MLVFSSGPVQLVGEFQFNLQSLKEMSVTESFLELDNTIRECQNVETFNDCETRLFIEKMLQECGCLPLSHILSEQVYKYYNKGSLQKDLQLKVLLLVV